MLKNIKNNKQGFTIIEVLIVLAIAGLIMLVVFLAVPALQRNSRNTQYRAEASRILGAYNENSANNAGAVLANGTHATGGAGIADVDNVFKSANTKNITALVIEDGAAGTTGPSLTQAVIRTAAKCVAAAPSAANTTTAGGATTAGSARQVVILFDVETTGGTQPQCQEA